MWRDEGPRRYSAANLHTIIRTGDSDTPLATLEFPAWLAPGSVIEFDTNLDGTVLETRIVLQPGLEGEAGTAYVLVVVEEHPDTIDKPSSWSDVLARFGVMRDQPRPSS
jgi:hypothetical protein